MASTPPISEYIVAIARTHSGGRAGELSYRTPLEILLCALLPPAISITHEGSRLAHVGAPDFLVYATQHSAARLIGCIETKDVHDQDLQGAGPNQRQFNRYKASIPNCVFTNYLRFAFYQNGELVDDVAIAHLSQNVIRPLPANHSRFIALLESAFIGQEFRINTADQLVSAMANRTRLLADAIFAALQSRHTRAGQTFATYMQTFKERLLQDITPAQFADLFAQTTAYGLLIARAKCPPDVPFTRQQASDLIPQSIHFLRGFYHLTAGNDIVHDIKWIVDSMADIFAAADIQTIMRRHGQQTGAQDPVFHFYESFLSKYDPKERANRGVWYTPEPVVNFIVRAVHHLLQSQLAIPNGLANTDTIAVPIAPAADAAKNAPQDAAPQTQTFHKVQILDPAAGTGAFLAETIRQIHALEQQGTWSDYVEQHLLPRLSGFEILMAPYAMAHLQLDALLSSLGYIPRHMPQPRHQVYLTDALKQQATDGGSLLTLWLAAEAKEAERIKRRAPVMCILGNPPYNVESANKGDWIMELMESYKQEPGGKQRLQEKNPKAINDDYVKFIRYAQHLIDKNGCGVLAFINPHNYLDAPTFRGMRWRLLTAFDSIYVIDLHGNARKKETSPDGGKDGNVFNIMQGVCINIFVKTGKKTDGALAQVFHHDLYGERDHKYQFLMDNSLDATPFQTLSPQEPMFYMVPRNYDLESEYQQGFSVAAIFTVGGVGAMTCHDDFSICHDKDELLRRFVKFQSSRRDAEFLHQEFSVKEKKGWDILAGQDNIKGAADLSQFIRPLAYRPFDTRWIFYEDKLVWRTVRHVMRHFIAGDNVGLAVCRQFKTGDAYQHVFITDKIMDSSFVSNRTSEVSYVFPLYLYAAPNQLGAPAAARTPNLNMEIVGKIADRIALQFSDQESDQTFTPHNLLDYIYAALHSPAYRKKYAQFLKTDFPRIPMPASAAHFHRLANIGQQLRQLHLLQHPAMQNSLVQYPTDGSGIVQKPEWKDGTVRINPTQRFTHVPQAAWRAQIGGYLPAQKFLKDRKNRALSTEDVTRYRRLVTALVQTLALVDTIDG